MNNGDSDKENHNNHIENNHIKQERYMLKEVKNNWIDTRIDFRAYDS